MSEIAWILPLEGRGRELICEREKRHIKALNEDEMRDRDRGRDRTWAENRRREYRAGY